MCELPDYIYDKREPHLVPVTRFKIILHVLFYLCTSGNLKEEFGENIPSEQVNEAVCLNEGKFSHYSLFIGYVFCLGICVLFEMIVLAMVAMTVELVVTVVVTVMSHSTMMLLMIVCNKDLTTKVLLQTNMLTRK